MENYHDKRTLQYLNSKVWYRFLKVIFGFCVLLAVGVYYSVIASGGIKNIDNSKTLISCTYGEKKIFTPDKIDIELPGYQFEDGFNYKNFFEGYNDYAIKIIFNNCYPQMDTDFDIFAVQKLSEVIGNDSLMMKAEERPDLTEFQNKYLDVVIPKIESSYINSDKASYLDYSVKLFDIKPSYTYTKFIKYLVLGGFIIFFFFEILRRVFYYIFLGNFRPKR